MKRTTGIVPVPHSRLLALGPFAGRGSQCCAPQRSLSYCDDDAQHSHVVETQETETPPGQVFHRRGQQLQPAARQALESRARRRPKGNWTPGRKDGELDRRRMEGPRTERQWLLVDWGTRFSMDLSGDRAPNETYSQH
ncbi:uncharacterized protein TrAFT101_001665 [Trichoderma asperellum]|uniref:uncharacterized protein n=1 Tax=Trichoderma asperellum TaxID=101201 RepID=UPI00331CD751|nr:hypothetical protein TrAFT101_001665 [Trichoderma asperellum]